MTTDHDRFRWTAPAALATTTSLAALLALSSGCTGSLNASNELLDAEPLPALAPSPDAPPPDDAPSINGLDRRNWQLTTMSVPRGQVEHQPTYWAEALPDRTLPRQRGEFPMGGDVLDGSGDPGAQVVEAGTNLVWTPIELPLAPVEMVAKNRWPWTTLRNHPDYQRVPSSTSRDPWIWITPPTSAGAAPATPALPAASAVPAADGAAKPTP